MFPPFIPTQADLGHNLAVKKKELRYPGPQCCKQTELPRGTPLAGNTFFFSLRICIQGGKKEQGAGEVKDSLLPYSAFLWLGQPQDGEETMSSPEYYYQLGNEKKGSIDVGRTISRSTKKCLPSPSSPSRSKITSPSPTCKCQ